MQGNNINNLISPTAADKLISAHDGDLALLYLFMLSRGSRDLEQAAGELCRTLGEMQAAYEKLSRMGLVTEGERCELPRTAPARKLLPADDELPEYTAEDIVSRTRGDAAFAAVLREAEQVFGKHLSTVELRKLYGIYDYYGLPAEVIMELLHYCVSVSNNRLPTLRFIEKQAGVWANMELLTLEQVEEYIARARQHREDMGRVSELLDIRGRKLSPTEEKYIASWLDMGFDNELIALAYDRTVTNTGGLKWGYMNKILMSWKEKGLFTVRDVEEKDSRRPLKTKPAAEQTIDMDKLKSVLDKI